MSAFKKEVEEVFPPLKSLFYKPYFGVHDFIIKTYKPKRVLEVGSGLGRTSLLYSKNNFQLILLDISSLVIHRTKNLYDLFDLKADFIVADVFNLPFKKECFDLCHNEGLLEHFSPSESSKIIKEMGSVSYLVMVAVPFRNDVFYNVYKLYNRIVLRKWVFGSLDKSVFQMKSERAYYIQDLVKEVNNSGLDVVMARTVGDGGSSSLIIDWYLEEFSTLLIEHGLLKNTQT